jgi:serine/threonine protein kinase
VLLKKDSRLGKYNIRERIGSGGMGVVYRAFDEQLQRQVAIKMIQGDKASDRDFLTRFKREALAISRIDHPHIVRLLEFVEATDSQPPYMVMEFLPGHDLGSVIQKGGPLAISRAVDRTLEAIAAVSECHRRGYIHRDLKPTNIFLAEYNQIETAKVLDFGAAKQEEQREGNGEDGAELTKKGTFLGTPFYMPPEQIMGRPATTKSDQYSLGVVLYTALTGKKPFDVDKKKEFKDWELLQSIKQGDYMPVQKLRADVPDGLAQAIAKAMNVDPDKRFIDLHAFGAALRAFASPQAHLTWEAHFTSSAPTSSRPPQLSIAINATIDIPKAASLDGPTNVDPTFPLPGSFHGTGPTAVARGERQQTMPISTRDLMAASGELSLATTSRRPSDPPSQSMSIEFVESSQSAKAPLSDNSPVAIVADSTAKRLFRNRPVLIVLGAVLLFAGVLAGALFITHQKEPAHVPQLPPPELLAPPLPAKPQITTAPAVTPAPTSPPVQPVVAPPPPVAAPPASPAATDARALPKAAAPEIKHHAHKKAKPQQLLDTHGIPIPTE